MIRLPPARGQCGTSSPAKGRLKMSGTPVETDGRAVLTERRSVAGCVCNPRDRDEVVYAEASSPSAIGTTQTFNSASMS